MTTKCASLIGIVTLIALAPPLNAQQAASTAAPAFEGGLQEVVVNARKVAESLVTIPVAVTALTAEQLEQRGIMDIHGLDAFTPGFTDVGGPAYGRFQRGVTDYVMRGMVPGRTVDPLRQNVSVFVDGVPVSGGNIAGLSDIQQVEVVKGPQSAFFGRATFAGAVNITTRQPGFEWNGKIDTQEASYGTTDTTVAVEGPVIPEVVAFRLSGRYYHTNGQYLNPGTGRLGEQETRSGTAQLLIKPTDNFKISLFGTFWTDDDGPQIDGVIGGPWSTVAPNAYNCNLGLVPPGQLNGVCGQLPGLNYVSLYKNVAAIADPGFFAVEALDQGVATVLKPGFINHFGLTRHARELHANAEYDFANGYTLNANIGSNSGELGTINDGIQEYVSDPGFLYGGYYAEDNQYLNQDWSAEVRLTSPRDRNLKWMVGANYLVETSYTADLGFYAGPFDAATPEEERANTTGYFGSISYDFPAQFTLTAEGRFQQDTVSALLFQLATGAARKTFNAFTPRVILSKALSDRSTAYVSYARGNKPGTFNLNLLGLNSSQLAVVLGQTNGQLSVPEETVDMYELGIKGDFLDERLRLLAAIYYGKWKNQQITKTGLYLAPTAAGGFAEVSIPVTASVGLTDLDGVELEGQYSILPGLIFEASFDFADNDIRQYSCTTCATYETGTDNVTGHKLGQTPRIKGSAALTYSHPVGSDFRGYIRGEYTYRGKIFADETNLTWIGAANKVNLRIGLSNDHYSLELIGRNLFNDKAYQSVAWAGTFLAPTIATINEWDVAPAEKPTIGLRFIAKYK